MFKPAKIYHATLIVEEKKVNQLIADLYEAGVCQLKESEIDLEVKYSYETAKTVDDINSRLNFMIDSLDDYKPILQPESRIKALFSSNPPFRHKIELRPDEEILDDVNGRLSLIEPKVTEKLDQLNKANETIQKNEFIVSNLSLFPEIKTELFRSSDNIKVITGRILNPSLDIVRVRLQDLCVRCIKEIDKTESFIAIFSLTEHAHDVEKVLHEVGFEVLDIPYEPKTPSEIIARLNKENDKFRKDIKTIEASLTKLYKENKTNLIILKEELSICLDKIEALHNFKTTKAFSVVEAWIPEKDLNKFNKLVEKNTKNYYLEIHERDDAPTIYDHPTIIRPFQALTNLYSPPKYNYFDPTPMLAFTFAIFFGLMLTDFVYGLALAVLAYFLLKGAGKHDINIKNTAIILMFFGISTLVWGAIFGSYFGDFFQKLGIKMPMLIDSMSDVLISLSMVLIIGALHMGTGLAIGFWENWKKVGVKEALAKQGVWLSFLISLILLLGAAISPIFVNLGLVVLGISVIMQVYFNYLDGGAITAVLSVFGFSGFLGDLFSYARLMALGVGTAGIALAVNFLVLLSVDMIPFVGIIFAIVIFILGHLFNMAMNGLGAFIHSTRLHFLEFFQKFYDGGGSLYKPFQSLRKTTYVEPTR